MQIVALASCSCAWSSSQCVHGLRSNQGCAVLAAAVDEVTVTLAQATNAAADLATVPVMTPTEQEGE